MKRFFTLFLTMVLAASIAYAQKPTKTINDASLQAGSTYTWSKDTTYLLDGYVFLKENSKLNIEAGTVIKGKRTPSDAAAKATALIVMRGAQIFAEGTATAPIIFTAEDDDVADATDLGPTDRGLWGGLVLLGRAPVNFLSGEGQVEGIPATETRARYGGTNADDNSGVLKYVSIRHNGAVLESNNELNGLTLGAVGRGTVIDYVETFATADDGFEWFGGTVNCSHLVSAFCDDEAFDYDEGWAGNGQFWFAVQGADKSDKGLEFDGGRDATAANFSNPTISNMTLIGAGATGTVAASNPVAVNFKEKAGGSILNSIITDYKSYALEIEDLAAGQLDPIQNIKDGKLKLANNYWFGFGRGNTLDQIIRVAATAEEPTATTLKAHLAANTNLIVDPKLAGISRIAGSKGLDPRPNGDSPVLKGAQIPADAFFAKVPYLGAFDNRNNWALSWTSVDKVGIFGDLATPAFANCDNPIVIKDADLVAGQTYNWTKDNCYLLDGYVFLKENSKLNIEAGTVIKGKRTPSDAAAKATALIVMRGAQIFAEGTATAPIIFTAEDDNVADATDLGPTDRGLWGGLVLLGRAPVNFLSGEGQVEGIPATESRARYGGTNADDNSGVLKYVSIRHNGAVLESNNELNGLTLGAVGRGTVIDYVETFATADDGFEWFGGTVNCKHLVSAFCDDEAFDYDEGWAGNGQFWFAVQGADKSDKGLEFDGGRDATAANFSNPTISNMTLIGAGATGTVAASNPVAVNFKEKAGGSILNSIITDYKSYALEIEDLAAGQLDPIQNIKDGKLKLANNYWFGFGRGNTLDQIIRVAATAEEPTATTLKAHLAANTNLIVDPKLRGISRIAGSKGLDPRPALNSPVLTGAVIPTNAFFDKVDYHGAFSVTNNWALKWTSVDYVKIFGDITTSVNDLFTEENGYILKSYPMPVRENLTIEFTLPATTEVNMMLYDLQGRMVKNLMTNRLYFGGENKVEFNVSDLVNGYYFLVMQNADATLVRKVVVSK